MSQPETDVENSTSVVERIQQLLEHYGLNANSATRKLGYGTSSKLYKILGGSEPSFPTLVDIATTFPEVSLEWLVLGKSPMLHTEQDQSAAAAPSKRMFGSQVLAVTVGKDGEENTSFVPVPAQAGYTRQFNEAVFLEQLRHYRIPGFEHGSYRAFEVSGDSMEPTLNHRDVVVASYVDNWRLLEPGDVYVVVTTESVMVKRIPARITDPDGEVLLLSDNPHRSPYPVDVSDIEELWRVRGFVSSYIPSAPDTTVERLWQVIELLGHDIGEVKRHLKETAPNSAPSA